MPCWSARMNEDLVAPALWLHRYILLQMALPLEWHHLLINTHHFIHGFAPEAVIEEVEERSHFEQLIAPWYLVVVVSKVEISLDVFPSI